MKDCKKIIITGIAIVIVISLSINWYYNYITTNMFKEMEKSCNKANQTIQEAEVSYENAMYLYKTSEESDNLRFHIDDVKRIMGSTSNIVSIVTKNYNDGNYSEVRRLLNDKSSENPMVVMNASIAELKKEVIGYCNRKINLRNNIVSNEWYLKSRLKKPVVDDYEGIPDGYKNHVPKESEVDRNALNALDPYLNNSMGVNLIKHHSILNHIQDRCNKIVYDRAFALYDNAQMNYKMVKPNNDFLHFYRDIKDDGKYSMTEYETLLNEQNKVLDFITNGDKLLENLVAYNQELHEQYYVYVSKNDRRHTTFSHSRTVPHINHKGELTTRTQHYSTDGYKFYYTLTTVSPNGVTHKEVYVGEKDEKDYFSYDSWDYNKNEKVGWVREWKKLHEDDSMKVSGWIKDLNPINVTE